GRKALQTVTEAEDHHACAGLGKGEAVDFVLGDEYALYRQAQPRELGGGDREVDEPLDCEARVQNAEAHLERLGRQPVAAREAPRFYSFGREHQIEQLREQGHTSFDELGVDAGDIELAEI